MESMGVNWWGDWDIGDGTIGQRYGATEQRLVYEGMADCLLSVHEYQLDVQGQMQLTDQFLMMHSGTRHLLAMR